MPESLFLINQPQPATLLKKALTQVFSCEFCEIFKNTFSYKKPPVATSVDSAAKVFGKSVLYKAQKVKSTFSTLC